MDRKKTSELQALFAAAARDHSAGRLVDAEQLYRRVLAVEPRHADSLHRLGIIGYQVGQFDAAVEFSRRAIEAEPAVAAYHSSLSLALAGLGRLEEAARAGEMAVGLAPDAVDAQVNLGLILMQLGRFEAAADHCRQAALLAPDLPDGHSSLGAVLHELGRSREAADCYHRALELEPDYPEAHTGLGNALVDLGLVQDAMAHHRRAIALRPDFAEAHYNLGQALRHAGDLDEAAAQFQEALRLQPGLVVAHSNLALILKAQGRLSEAEAGLREALAATGDHPTILDAMALVLLAQGRPGEATQAVARSLAVQETPSAKSVFVRCVRHLDGRSDGESLRGLLVRALSESWARPEALSPVAFAVIRQDPRIVASVARAQLAWPGPIKECRLYGEDGVSSVAGNDLLEALLCATPNIDFELERFLTLARQVLLDSAEAGTLPNGALGFCAALARQCFLNEYVFSVSDDEQRRAHALSERLAGEGVTPAMLLAVACYLPLSSVPQTGRLMAGSWPAPVEAVLRQQIVEVGEEAALKPDIPVLTPIRDDGSLKVRAQYEENPYPRWLEAGSADPAQGVADYLIANFPLAGLQPVSAAFDPEILVAGCGTGRNAVDTARMFKGARTLAIDLSRASLAHALRKTREAEVANLTYAQADLLEVRALGRSFDLIEAVGVLHHLQDPFAGWRAMLAVLRPGGVMKLGLYSATSRRNLPHMDIGTPTAEVIRASRQTLAAQDDETAHEALRAPDFYSLSGCRDLLFHVQETRLTLGEIDAFLKAAGLSFLGFELPADVLAAYQVRFPQDPAATDLDCWATFEIEHPSTFAAMYQFWVQKPQA